MHFKVLLISLLFLSINNLNAQFQANYDSHTYVVQWTNGASALQKATFQTEFRSQVLCEMTFGTREFAWVEYIGDYRNAAINGFAIIDIDNLLQSININGGVIGPQPPPVIDGTSLDYLTDMIRNPASPNSSCISNYDLAMPFGMHPVSLFNLDTGVTMPLNDSNTNDFNFDGLVTCHGNASNQNQACDDNNGHGTHGIGIQQYIINRNINEFINPSTIKLYSYKVFDEEGEGNLGAILCSLSEVIRNPAVRKVVNCSFSYKGEISPNLFDPLKFAFIAMATENIFSVIAAGNDSDVIDLHNLVYPTCYFSDLLMENLLMASSTISIGAASCDLSPAPYTNASPTEVDISFLGTLAGPDLGTGIDYYEGTSQATFATSIFAATLLSHQTVADLDQIKCSLISSADIDPDFYQSNTSGGVIRASVALEKLQNGCTLSENCPPIRFVTGLIQEVGYESSGIIISNAKASNNNFSFKAKKSIILNQGFEVSPTVQFSAIIDNCRLD